MELGFRRAHPDEVVILQQLMAVAFDISEENAAGLYKADNLEALGAHYYLALLNDVAFYRYIIKNRPTDTHVVSV